jgi:hypothetical protein
VSSAGTLDESLPDSLQTLERETPPVQVATASTSDLVDSGAKEAASAATLDEQLPDSSQALVPETPPDGKEAVTSTETLECLTSEACIDQYLWSVYQRAPKEDTTKATTPLSNTDLSKEPEDPVTPQIIKPISSTVLTDSPRPPSKSSRRSCDFVAQALGRKGIMLVVPMKVTIDPSAPKMPSLELQ